MTHFPLQVNSSTNQNSTCVYRHIRWLFEGLNSHSPCPRIAKELDKQAPMRDHKSQITLLNRNKNAQVLPNELT